MKLVVLEGPAARPSFEIFNERTLIGRAPDCDVMVFDAQVSRHHAQILKLGDAYVFESLQPANPSIVNDRVITTRRQLVDGDLIVLGSVVLEVDIPPPTIAAAHEVAPTAAVPSPMAHEAPTAPAPAAPGGPGAPRPVAPAAPAASPSASVVPAPAAPAAAPIVPAAEQRRPTRPRALPTLPPREQIKAIAARLGEAGQRIKSRAAVQQQDHAVTAADAPSVERIVADHERLGGDQELARLATLLSERLSNQTDIRALYRLGAEAAALIAWTRLAQRSMEEAAHLAQALGVH